VTSVGPQAEPRPIITSVGREREFADLRAGRSEVSAGRSYLFLLSREPGIGKTSLRDEFRLLAVAHGVRFVWGRCREGGGAPAYWPWIQVLHTCLADTDAEQRAAIFGCEATPFVLVPQKNPIQVGRTHRTLKP
jgi:eukaryotic-like serine/threonine-protein kinase